MILALWYSLFRFLSYVRGRVVAPTAVRVDLVHLSCLRVEWLHVVHVCRLDTCTALVVALGKLFGAESGGCIFYSSSRNDNNSRNTPRTPNTSARARLFTLLPAVLMGVSHRCRRPTGRECSAGGPGWKEADGSRGDTGASQASAGVQVPRRVSGGG